MHICSAELVFHEAFVALSCCLLPRWLLRGVSHRLLLGESEWGSRAVGGEARVGVRGLVGGGLSVGVVRQEGNGRVGGSRLRLGELVHVADTLVAHVFSWVQRLFWMPPGVLHGGEERRTCCRVTEVLHFMSD